MAGNELIGGGIESQGNDGSMTRSIDHQPPSSTVIDICHIQVQYICAYVSACAYMYST